MSKVPCKDCITFAICNAYVKEMENVRPLMTRRQCALLLEYTEGNKYVEGRIIDNIRFVFGLEPAELHLRRSYKYIRR